MSPPSDDTLDPRSLQPMRSLPPFSSFPLLSKQTLVPSNPSSSRPIRAVVRLSFAYPGHFPIDCTTHHVKAVRNIYWKPRTYTPIWPCGQNNFDLIIKVYEGGFSEWLSNLDAGTAVTFIGPIPLPVKPLTYRPGKHAVIVALGIGITLGIAAVRKEMEEGRSVCLVWGVRYGEEYFMKEEIAEVEEKGANVVRVVSGEDVEGCLRGRVDEKVLRGCVEGWDVDDVRFLVVGTKDMIRGVWKVIQGMGFERREHELVRKGM